MNKRTKRVKAIFNKIISISQKGNDSYLVYYNYIDDIIRNNEYVLLQDVFSIYFKTDIRKWNNIPVLKQESWKVATNNTETIFNYRLKDYYDINNVFQIGQKIYDVVDNELLGKFVELERKNEVNYHGITYSFASTYKYYDNTDLYQLSAIDATKSNKAGISGIAKDIILEVQIGAFDTDTKVLLNNPNMSLLDKYKAGVQLLIKQNPSINDYIDNNYGEDYFE